METNKATVARIRPVAWKVCVQGEDCVSHVRSVLSEHGVDCSDPAREPGLHEAPMFSFLATSKAETPLTAPELRAILDQNDRIEVAFET